MEWSREVTAADWWVDRLRPFGDYVIGSLVPGGFDAVTRIFHPIEDEPSVPSGRWGDLAALNGRTAHAHMHLHRIASRPGEDLGWNDGPDVHWGSTPRAEVDRIAAVLVEAGTTGAVWFGFTTIDATFQTEATDGLPVAGRASSRTYYLIRASLAEIDDVCRFANDDPPFDAWIPTPTIWWPDDQTWFVANDVDIAWTYVAGSNTLVSAIEAHPGLEALRTTFDASDTFDSDTLNTP
ncbi:MAG: hypothetical protein AAF467_21895 [Actinomycetota bacterium]